MIQTNDSNTACMADDVRRAAEDPMKSKLSKGQGETILVIEDEEMLRDFLQTILGDSGYNVILAADGTEGVRIYLEHMKKIDLVLLDMGLPKLSGEDVLSRIVTSNPNVKVIAASGSFESEVQAAALRIGAVDYLPKPYLMNDLLVKIDRSLHGGT